MQHSIKSQGKDKIAEDSMKSLVWRMYVFDIDRCECALSTPPYIPSWHSLNYQDKGNLIGDLSVFPTLKSRIVSSSPVPLEEFDSLSLNQSIEWEAPFPFTKWKSLAIKNISADLSTSELTKRMPYQQETWWTVWTIRTYVPWKRTIRGDRWTPEI